MASNRLYTIHDPDTHAKVQEFRSLSAAFKRAYSYLPLDPPGPANPAGKFVGVQEWDEKFNPLRQWRISGTPVSQTN